MQDVQSLEEGKHVGLTVLDKSNELSCDETMDGSFSS